MKEKLMNMLAKYKGVDVSEIDADAPFNSLGLDSLDVADLVIQLEGEIGKEIELSPKYKNINELAAYIESVI